MLCDRRKTVVLLFVNTNRDLSICPSCENTSMTMTERERDVKIYYSKEISSSVCFGCFGFVFGPSE